ncbi:MULTISPECIES: RagB/SusD family nutrient uptake outer membrane protein [Butyricimonas]|uniref:RagB/SusD family nutrient uptake outer membrane protein n=1 Tax=Butyricimonas TaxID=574697 RepID=UPI0007FB3189|nr:MULTISPECIES: RagB/SusD family nutrient uptake outer membrane protein [Butyricimonas]
MRKIWIILLLSMGLLSACDDFLDVTSDNVVVEDELFADYKGVRMAVNGVYRELSGSGLYGYNLMWGFASALGHNYQTSSTSYLPTGLYYGAQFNWENSSVEEISETMWKKAFNVISTCNNIIQQVEAKDTSFFEVGKTERDMILGEMYGVRALLHFEMFRFYCPAPVTGLSGKMPYVEMYPDYQPKHREASEVMSLIIRDMEKAKTMLAEVDTVFCRSWCSSMTSRIRQSNSWSSAPPNEFMSYRGCRMNFWGATALLARMYMYNGDEDMAYENARIIYSFHTRNWFRWTSASYQGSISSVEYIHTKRPEEILLCFSNNNNYDQWEARIGTSNYMFRMKNIDHLFAGDEDDYRKVGWYNRYGFQRYLTWIRPVGSSYNATNLATNQGPLLPVISFPEMYHIMIEYLIDKNRIPEAVTLFNTLRRNRGAKAALPETIYPEDLKEKLVYDIIRETLTSGQTFFMFKRLNRNIYNGSSNITMEPKNWTMPLPQSETDYQF